MDTERFRKRLRAKERELELNISRLEAQARTSGQAEVRDPTDEATVSQGTSESLEEEMLESRTLAEVRDALRRIEDGTYGQCGSCGRQIEAARLEAIPWARYCIQDQEERDKAAGVRTGGATL